MTVAGAIGDFEVVGVGVGVGVGVPEVLTVPWSEEPAEGVLELLAVAEDVGCVVAEEPSAATSLLCCEQAEAAMRTTPTAT